ncbi:MAG: helix-turn-helix transcriptional regulator [Solirubrobacterales bacterium]
MDVIAERRPKRIERRPEPVRTPYAALLRAARVELGWTQADLAEAANRTQGEVSALEAGRWPAPALAADVAGALHRSPESIWGTL